MLTIESPAFSDGERIPAKYTCDAETAVSIPLRFSGIPEDAKSLVLIMDDPDVPKARRPDGLFDHWVLFNIPPETRDIPEGGAAGVAGANTAGKTGYAGPCPPKEYEPSEHRYFFKLFALDTGLPLAEGATRAEVEEAMHGHMLATAECMGRYKRQ